MTELMYTVTNTKLRGRQLLTQNKGYIYKGE